MLKIFMAFIFGRWYSIQRFHYKAAVPPARPSSRTTFGIVVYFVVRVDERNEVACLIKWSLM